MKYEINLQPSTFNLYPSTFTLFPFPFSLLSLAPSPLLVIQNTLIKNLKLQAASIWASVLRIVNILYAYDKADY